MADGDRGWVLLPALGGLLAVQTVLLAWALASPESLPAGADIAVVPLAVTTAVIFGIHARRRATRDDDSWWRPDWRQWAVAGVFPGANAGVLLGYLLRRREVGRAAEPSGYWKRPLVFGVVFTTVGSLVTRQYFDPGSLSPLGALVLVAVLVAVGFTLVAAYYDIQYVALAREAAGREWLADGLHWLIPLGFPIPGRIFFLAIYVFRRRVMLGRLAEDGHIEHLPTVVTDDDGDGEDSSDDGTDPAILPIE